VAVVARFLVRFRAIVILPVRLRRVVDFVAVRRRFFAPLRFCLFAANIFFVARFCAAVRRFFRLGGFTMNSVPIVALR
jgi:hypothetical protein